VFLELRGYLDYNRLDHELSYWRSRSQFEVDFCRWRDRRRGQIQKPGFAASLPGLDAFGGEVRLKRKIVVSREKTRRSDWLTSARKNSAY
jgi:hypothetical protein